MNLHCGNQCLIRGDNLENINFIIFRLWQRYDFHHTGMVNYKEFLARLGVAVASQFKPLPDNAKGGIYSEKIQFIFYLQFHCLE